MWRSVWSVWRQVGQSEEVRVAAGPRLVLEEHDEDLVVVVLLDDHRFHRRGNADVDLAGTLEAVVNQLLRVPRGSCRARGRLRRPSALRSSAGEACRGTAGGGRPARGARSVASPSCRRWTASRGRCAPPCRPGAVPFFPEPASNDGWRCTWLPPATTACSPPAFPSAGTRGRRPESGSRRRSRGCGTCGRPRTATGCDDERRGRRRHAVRAQERRLPQASARAARSLLGRPKAKSRPMPASAQ